jgi:sarcosine oxidase subunit alpha
MNDDLKVSDVLIIGAGPAGLSAAIECAKQGFQVRVVDEFVKPGGRLLGQLHEEPNGVWWNGLDVAKSLTEEALALGVKLQTGVSVYHMKQEDEEWKVYTTEDTMTVKKLLLATGAAETALPIPGWTLPGVMSIGASQVMTNVQRVKVGERGMVIGINILSVAIARELQLAGIKVDQMILPGKNPLTEEAGDPGKVMDSLLRVAHLAPSLLVRLGSRLMKSKVLKDLGLKLYPRRGFKFWDIPIVIKKAALEIVGEGQVEGVRTVMLDGAGQPISGSEQIEEVDFVCIAGGLYPLVELAAVAGCPFSYIPELGGHVPLHSERMKTPLQNLYVAGNITGIESAKVALAQGKVAGLSIAYDFIKEQQSHQNLESLSYQLDEAVLEVENQRKGALIQFNPHIHQGRSAVQEQFNQLLSNSSI